MSETGKASASKDIHVEIMRSQLGRVRGLGASKSGVGHWWAERVTSIALVPLTLWFVAAVYRFIGAGQGDIAAWMSNPINLTLMILLVVITFHHMQLGLQVVIEDYIHRDATRFGLLLLNKGAALVLGTICVVCALRIGL